MPYISEMKVSKYLAKSDLPEEGSKFTIRGVRQINVARDDQPKELKWALDLVECDKPFVMNQTNAAIAASVLKAQMRAGENPEHTDSWIGKRIGIKWDPSVQFMGKIVGGLRVCDSRTIGAPKPALQQAPSPTPGEDDVPF